MKIHLQQRLHPEVSMNSSQRATTVTTVPGAEVRDQPLAAWLADDDEALGCECANPALQIERWGAEAPAPVRMAC
jgi:hypothetical protein